MTTGGAVRRKFLTLASVQYLQRKRTQFLQLKMTLQGHDFRKNETSPLGVRIKARLVRVRVSFRVRVRLWLGL